jgi:hypothetical protein
MCGVASNARSVGELDAQHAGEALLGSVAARSL